MAYTSAFRRSVAADTKKKGGKNKGAFYEKYRIPQDSPTNLIIMRGSYTDPNPPAELLEIDAATGRPKPVVNPYWKAKEHTRKSAKNGREFFATEICSAGNDPHNPQPCVGCYAQDTGDKSVSLKDIFALAICHLGFYHGHPLIDREKGGIVVKKDGSGPVMIDSECQGRTCNFCRVLQGQPPFPPAQGEEAWPGFDPRTLTTVFGKKRYIQLGKNHLSDIMGFDQTIMSNCGTCKQQLSTDGFACPNCNSLIIDMNNEPRTDEQIADEVNRPYPCMRCQRPVLLREVVSCDACENRGQHGVQLSVFDVVIRCLRQGESTNSHVVLQHSSSIEEYAAGVDPRFLNGKTLRQHIEELMKEPYNFEEIYRPRNMPDQAKRLELPMPPGFGAPAGQAPYAAYGAPPTQSFMQPGAVPPVGYAQPTPGGFPPPGVATSGYAQPVPGSYQPAPAPGYAQPAPGYAPAPTQPFTTTAPGPQPFVPPGRPNYGQ